MADALISHARRTIWRVWAAPVTAGMPLRGLPTVPSASRRQAATDAASIGDVLPARPRAASPRPEAHDLMASAI